MNELSLDPLKVQQWQERNLTIAKMLFSLNKFKSTNYLMLLNVVDEFLTRKGLFSRSDSSLAALTAL